MDTLLQLLILALGTWQTVEVLHHSKIMYPLRKVEKDTYEATGDIIAEAWGCPFCLSHWVAAGYALGLISPLTSVVSWWLLVLSAVRLANLGNDLTWNYCRTPRYEGEDTNGDA
jgi:hypothetical protein